MTPISHWLLLVSDHRSFGFTTITGIPSVRASLLAGNFWAQRRTREEITSNNQNQNEKIGKTQNAKVKWIGEGKNTTLFH